MDALSEAQIILIEARANAATEGPWDYRGLTMSYHVARLIDGRYHASPRVVHATLGASVHDADNPKTGAGGVRKIQDAEFIAHARTDVPALIATIQDLRSQRDKFSTLADERHDLLCAERRANDELRAERAKMLAALERHNKSENQLKK